MLQDTANIHDNDAVSSPSTMLPSLSASLPSPDEQKASVPTLVLKPNRPVRMTRNVDAWNRLQRIQDIQVQPADTSSNQEQQYAISVFLRHNQSRIPTVNNSANGTSPLLGSPSSAAASAAASTSKPNSYVLRSFAELETLRTQVQDSIRQHHPVYCELCDGLSLLMLTKLSLPTLLTMTIHRSRASRAKKMRKVVLRVLTELHENKAKCVSACRGQHDLPLLLHSFMFGEEETQAVEAVPSASTRDEQPSTQS